MNKAQAHIENSHTVLLPRALDANVAATLAPLLDQARGENLTLDATYVESVGPECAALLRTAIQSWATDHRAMSVIKGAPTSAPMPIASVSDLCAR